MSVTKDVVERLSAYLDDRLFRERMHLEGRKYAWHRFWQMHACHMLLELPEKLDEIIEIAHKQAVVLESVITARRLQERKAAGLV